MTMSEMEAALQLTFAPRPTAASPRELGVGDIAGREDFGAFLLMRVREGLVDEGVLPTARA